MQFSTIANSKSQKRNVKIESYDDLRNKNSYCVSPFAAIVEHLQKIRKKHRQKNKFVIRRQICRTWAADPLDAEGMLGRNIEPAFPRRPLKSCPPTTQHTFSFTKYNIKKSYTHKKSYYGNMVINSEISFEQQTKTVTNRTVARPIPTE